MKFTNLPYRKNVSSIITKNSKYLLVQHPNYKENEWKFPSGGVEENETIERACLRELKEELGTDKFRIIFKSKIKNKYDWPTEIIKKKGLKWKGQEQSIIILEFIGINKELKVDKSEIKKHKWVGGKELKKYLIFPNQFETFIKSIEEYEKFIKNF